MKQVFLEKGKAVTRSVSLPLLQAGMVLVQVHYSFVSSGTEGAALQASGKSLAQKVLQNSKVSFEKVAQSLKDYGLAGTIALVQGKMNQLMEIGYSCSGIIVAVAPDITHLKIGDAVACAGAGLASHAEFVAVPQNLIVLLQDKNQLKQASITTIGAIALQGIRRADLKIGEKICVVGLGLLGQLTVQLAKLAGCMVIGIDLDEERTILAKKNGCDFVLNPTDVDVINDIAFITQHYGVDATIITAAASSGKLLADAMEFTRRKGKVVLVGDVKIDIPRDPLYTKEIDFLISCSYGPGRYDATYEHTGIDYPYAYVRWTENRNMQLIAQLIESKQLKINDLIAQEFSLYSVSEAYQALESKKNLGLVLTYPVQATYSFKPAQRAFPSLGYKAPQGKLKIAVIGAGGFTKTKLLPLLAQQEKIKIEAIIDAHGLTALQVAKQYGALKSGNDFNEILADDSIDAVVIATPHALHAAQALACLQAGKAVFMEKPTAVTHQELLHIEQCLLQNPTLPFMVDFNRSWAPYIQAIKKSIFQRATPLFIIYRMNAGFLPLTHWIQNNKNGGRVIGEACHIFELFLYLTDATPVSFMVQTLGRRDDALQTDNVSVQIHFNDGSLATLFYTSQGNSKLEKERMELFVDGKSFVMSDYKELQGYGVAANFNQKSSTQDKGHQALLEQFIKVATDEKQPLTDEYKKLQARMLLASKLTLMIHDSAITGGGFVRLDGEEREQKSEFVVFEENKTSFSHDLEDPVIPG